MARVSWNPCSRLPRRLQLVVSLALFVFLCIVIHSATTGHDDNDPTLPDVSFFTKVQAGTHRLPHPFKAPAHSPASNQTEAKWFTDWSWRKPYSSATTLDEDRAVLPPLPARPAIYTYFSWEGKAKDDKSRKAEQDLLQVWRRAWWAKGFRPVVLSNSEAVKHPLYDNVKALKLSRELRIELMRWMAWATMGDGILSDYLAVPMASYEDDLLAFLRRGQFPQLERFQGLDNALFVGTKKDIENAVKEVVKSPVTIADNVVESALSENIVLHKGPAKAIALYSPHVIEAKYHLIKERMDEEATRADGMAMLPQLINGHLHNTWQSQFKKIAVLRPKPEHTSTLIEPAFELARNLSQCPITPIADSCPPNIPNCKPCANKPLIITSPKVYRNDSSAFVIGTVPHPYTFTSLLRSRDNLDLRFIRRETDRDVWIQATTDELLGSIISSYDRLPRFKDAVASAFNSPTSLWLTAERPVANDDYDELDWTFGFKVPRVTQQDGSKSSFGGDAKLVGDDDDTRLTSKELARERILLEKAKILMWDVVDIEGNSVAQIKEITEAWNLADTEAWKFVRAYNARRTQERNKWESEEEAFLGTARLERWMNKIS